MAGAAWNDHVRMTPRAALRLLPALGAAIAAGALACGCGSGSPAAVLDPVADAAQRTNDADGAGVAMQIAVTATGLPQQITIDAGGHVQFKSQEGEISMQLNGVPGAAAGGLGEGGTIDERFVGGKMFMSSSAFAGNLPAGASWIELDLAAAEKKLGLDPSALSSGESNPAQFLEYLRASGGACSSRAQNGPGRRDDALQRHDRPAQGAGRGFRGREAGHRRDRRGDRDEHVPGPGLGGRQQLIRRFSLAMPLAVRRPPP